MTTEKALALRKETQLQVEAKRTPAEIVADATDQANVLMDIVERKKLYEVIENKKYLYVEGWQTIGAFANVNAVTEWVKPIERDGEIIAYEAKVNLYHYGEIVGGAELTCGLDEFPCRGKEGGAKHKAARSAAQTWAESKAYRMKFGYIARLAGYEPTPAEEMLGTGKADLTTADKRKEHWCFEHNKSFFKTPKMKWWAHPMDEKDADGKTMWCNESKEEKLDAAQSQEADIKAETSDWAEVYQLARLKGITKTKDLCDILGVNKLKNVEKGFALKKLAELPDLP